MAEMELSNDSLEWYILVGGIDMSTDFFAGMISKFFWTQPTAVLGSNF